MDRGYIDLEHLQALYEAGSFFVTRAKSNMKADRRYSYPVDVWHPHLNKAIAAIPHAVTMRLNLRD